MNDFYDKEEFNQEDINRIIEEEWEESLNLEFKSADSLLNTPEKKKEISKDVSSIANSAGGIIIYGISEQEHVAKEVSFIDGNKFSKEWIEQVINSNIHRKINQILIYPVRFKNIKETVYVIKIPQSDRRPHMAKDKKYYKRFNFESVAMEEYEIRDMYNAINNTNLSIVDVEGRKFGTSAGNYVFAGFEINFIIENESNSIEQQYKIETNLPNSMRQLKHKQDEFEYLADDKRTYYSVPNKSPLFQGERTSLCPFHIRIGKNNFKNEDNFKINVKLYYSNGMKEYNYDLRDILTLDGKKISENMFHD